MNAEQKKVVLCDVYDSLICQLLEAKDKIEYLSFVIDLLQEDKRKAFYDIDNRMSDLKEKYTQITKNKYDFDFIEMGYAIDDLNSGISEDLQDFRGTMDDIKNILFEMSDLLCFVL